MTLVQIFERTGTVDRVPRGTTPVVELDLQPGERVVSLELHELFSYRPRKTVDWTWTVVVEHRLGGPSIFDGPFDLGVEIGRMFTGGSSVRR